VMKTRIPKVMKLEKRKVWMTLRRRKGGVYLDLDPKHPFEDRREILPVLAVQEGGMGRLWNDDDNGVSIRSGPKQRANKVKVG